MWMIGFDDTKTLSEAFKNTNYPLKFNRLWVWDWFMYCVLIPPPPWNIDMSFLLLSFYSLSVSTTMTYYIILDGGLPATQCRHGIPSWRITLLFSPTVLSMLPLSSILFCIYRIATGNENGIPSNELVDSLDICGTIISIFKYYCRSPLTKELFLVIG